MLNLEIIYFCLTYYGETKINFYQNVLCFAMKHTFLEKQFTIASTM